MRILLKLIFFETDLLYREYILQKNRVNLYNKEAYD